MSLALNDGTDEGVEVHVRSWPEASRMFTAHERRLRAAEDVTKPISKIWRTVKWGGLATGVGLLLGASPGSPLGQFLAWVVANAPQ